MDIDFKIGFGRYKGLSIRQIFCGTINIDRTLLCEYLQWRLRRGDTLTNENGITLDMYNFNITEDAIKVTPTLSDFNFDASKAIEKLFLSSDTRDARHANLSLDKFCYDIYLKDNILKIESGGVPDYIAWCIREVENFFINPSQITLLENAPVNYFIGISVEYMYDYTYRYYPKFVQKLYKFPERTLKINSTKASQPGS